MAYEFKATRNYLVAIRNIITMARKHPELVCLSLAVLCSLLSKVSLKKVETPVYREQPPPKHFFNSKTYFLDFPFGNLQNVGALLERKEVLFVMFYAPWCSHSQRLRLEFETAAQYMKGELTFVAINCWYPKGQCKQKNNFEEFPVFYLYFHDRDGYRFTGVASAANLIQFAQTLLHPYEFVTSQEQLVMFLAQHDNVLVGYFDFNLGPHPPGFYQFYFASLRVYEADPRNPVRFALVTHPQLAESFGMKNSSTVYYCRALNDTIKYPVSKNFTMTQLSKWALSLRTHAPVKWLLPSGAKSLALSTELEQGPAVIAFLPDTPLLGINFYVSILREVALLYGDCAGADDKWRELAQTSQYGRWAALSQHLGKLQRCVQHWNEPPESPQSDETSKEEQDTELPYTQCCITLTFTNHSLTAASSSTRPHTPAPASPAGPAPVSACDACVNYAPESALWGRACRLLSAAQLQEDTGLSGHDGGGGAWASGVGPPVGCSGRQHTYNPSEYLSFCCDRSDALSLGRKLRGPNLPSLVQRKSTIPSDNTTPDIQPHHHLRIDDPFIARNVGERLLQRECDKVRFQRDQGWLPPIDIAGMGFGNQPAAINIRDTGCQANRTVNFYAMKFNESSLFLRAITGEMSGEVKETQRSAVVLVDIEEDFQHVMSGKFSRQNLLMLLSNFSEGALARHLRSETPAQHLQAPAYEDPPPADTTYGGLTEEEVVVTEVTSATFEEIVMNPQQDVVLLYYAPWCGFCKALTHTFLSLAHYFSDTPNITFARINGAVNDLAWQFTVESYPTIIIYPAHNKAQSAAFPDHLQKTLPTLVQFVLRYTHLPTLRLRTGLGTCSDTCIRHNLQRSGAHIARLQRDIGALVGSIRRLRSHIAHLQLADIPRPAPTPIGVGDNTIDGEPGASGLRTDTCVGGECLNRPSGATIDKTGDYSGSSQENTKDASQSGPKHQGGPSDHGMDIVEDVKDIESESDIEKMLTDGDSEDIKILRELLTETREQGSCDQSSRVTSSNARRVQILEERVQILSLQVQHKYHQMRYTRKLYQVLSTASTTGGLTRHRVEVILNQYKVHQKQYEGLIEQLGKVLTQTKESRTMDKL